jgi:integrase
MRQIEPPPVHRKSNDWLRPDEDAKVLDACLTRDERLAIFLLRFTGVRASEAVNLRWSDIEWQNGQLWVSIKKSKTARGIRRIPVPRELAPLLVRPGVLNQEDAYLFQTRTGKPWHRNQLYAVVRRVGQRAGVDLYPAPTSQDARIGSLQRGRRPVDDLADSWPLFNHDYGTGLCRTDDRSNRAGLLGGGGLGAFRESFATPIDALAGSQSPVSDLPSTCR